MSEIAKTLGTTAALRSLELTTAAAQEVSLNLATGRKVNSAVDAPGAFFTARALDARASELANLNDGFSNAIGALEADMNAVEGTRRLLDQLDALAREARRNAAPPDPISKAILGHAFVDGGGNPDPTAKVTDIPALAGKKPVLTVVAPGRDPYRHDFDVDGKTVGDLITKINASTGTSGISASLDANGKLVLAAPGSIPLSLGSFKASGGLSVKIYQTTAGGIGNIGRAEDVVTRSLNGDAQYEFIGEFETTSVDYPPGLSNAVDGNGRQKGASQQGRLRTFLGPEGDDFIDTKYGVGNPGPTVNKMVFVIEGDLNIPPGGTQAFDVFSDDGFRLTVGGTTVVEKNGNQAPAWVNGNVASTGGVQKMRLIYWENTGKEALRVVSKDVNGNEVPLAGDFISQEPPVEPSTEYYARAQVLQEQLTDLVGDSSFLGRTVGEGDPLKVALNERGSRLETRLAPIASRGLGLERLSQLDWLGDFDKVDDTIREARETLEAQASRTGATLAILEIRRDFNNGIADTLRTGAGDLVLADPNLEGARMLANQTRSQLASQALRLTTQADQSVLSLFR